MLKRDTRTSTTPMECLSRTKWCQRGRAQISSKTSPRIMFSKDWLVTHYVTVSQDVLIKKYATVLRKNPDDVCGKTESRNNVILNFSSICEIAHKHDIWSNPKYKETYWRIKIHGLGKCSCIWIASFSRILGSKLFKVTFWVSSFDNKNKNHVIIIFLCSWFIDPSEF